jgi:hypothetical protein
MPSSSRVVVPYNPGAAARRFGRYGAVVRKALGKVNLVYDAINFGWYAGDKVTRLLTGRGIRHHMKDKGRKGTFYSNVPSSEKSVSTRPLYGSAPSPIYGSAPDGGFSRTHVYAPQGLSYLRRVRKIKASVY